MDLSKLALTLEIQSTYHRESLVKALRHADSGHTGGSSSSLDILISLMEGGIVRHDPKNPKWRGRDRIIIAGHKAPAASAVLAYSGYFGDEGVKLFEDTYRDFGSIFQGHLCNHTTLGVEISTGSLGQTISAAAAMAHRFKVEGRDNKVYVIVGDGELQEGQNWEALMSANKYHLDNLVIIVDRNQLQIDGTVANIMPLDPLKKKFESFGAYVREVDVHTVGKVDINYEGLLVTLNEAKGYHDEKHQVIIANTVKAFGMGEMENSVGSHGTVPSVEQAGKIIQSLIKRRGGLEKAARVNMMPDIYIPNKGLTGTTLKPSYEQVLIDLTAPEFAAFQKGKKVATREAYGSVLQYLARLDNVDLWVCGADLERSTTGEKVEKVLAFDRRRHIDFGVAEANMIGWISGLSASEPSNNRRPVIFGSSFGVFLPGRCYDQIRNTLAYSELAGILIGTHGGLFTGKDGGTHQGLEEIGMMRSIPGMRVYSPSDVVSAVKSLEAAINYNGPSYVRLAREPTEIMSDLGSTLDPYKANIIVDHYHLDKGAIFSTGHMLKFALAAALQLQTDGINVAVYDFNCLKPIDHEAIAIARKLKGPIVTVEDHWTINGFGAAVSEYAHVPLDQRIGVHDKFGQTGRPVEDLLVHYHMTPGDIAATMRRSIEKSA